MYLAFTLSAQCLIEGWEVFMFVSAVVVLRRVVGEDCADIIILPRGNAVESKVNDFVRDGELKTGGNRVGPWSSVKMSNLGQKQTYAAHTLMSA